MTWRNCSGVSRVAGTAVPMPALLTSTSTRPNSAIAAATSAVQTPGRPRRWRRRRAAAGVADQGRGVLEPVDAPGAEHHVGARLGQCLGEGDAEAAGGAGHDRDLAVEPEQVGDRHGRGG